MGLDSRSIRSQGEQFKFDGEWERGPSTLWDTGTPTGSLPGALPRSTPEEGRRAQGALGCPQQPQLTAVGRTSEAGAFSGAWPCSSHTGQSSGVASSARSGASRGKGVLLVWEEFAERMTATISHLVGGVWRLLHP